MQYGPGCARVGRRLENQGLHQRQGSWTAGAWQRLTRSRVEMLTEEVIKSDLRHSGCSVMWSFKIKILSISF